VDVRNRAGRREGKFWRVGDGFKSGDSYVTDQADVGERELAWKGEEGRKGRRIEEGQREHKRGGLTRKKFKYEKYKSICKISLHKGIRIDRIGDFHVEKFRKVPCTENCAVSEERR
jgi:hypothetical protein